MAPVDTKLTGFISNAKNQFHPIRVKLNNRWVTKFQCIYPGCSKRKLQHGNGEQQTQQRLETTYTQLYVHAIRFHKSGYRKLTRTEIEREPLATGPNNIGVPIKDNLEKCENESTRVSTTAINFKPPSQTLKALNDWRVLL